MKKYHSDVAIIIPSRLDSSRLDKKPLKVIGDKTMIEHVLLSVKNTGLQNIYLTTDSEKIAALALKVNIKCIIVKSSCLSGSDRVYKAFTLINDRNIKYIINVQGDMPFVNPKIIINVIEMLKTSPYHMVTPVTKVSFDIANNINSVKVVVDNFSKALYFSRALIPYGAKEYLYHIGIYGFHRDALLKFNNTPNSTLEIQEKLEQLRALQHGIDIGVCYVDHIPISIDTQEDLVKANLYIKNLKHEI